MNTPGNSESLRTAFSGDLEPLFRRFASAADGADLGAAIESGEQFVTQLEEVRREALYTLFRLHAAGSGREEAYLWLERTLAADWWDFGRMQEDEALGDIRKEDRFRSSLRGAWARGYIAMLDRPEREAFQKPEAVMAALAVRPGDRVIEVGGGSGYFTVRLARAVGPEGRVLTTDIRQEMLDHIAARLERERIGNVELKRVAPGDPAPPRNWADLVFVADTIHYIRPLGEYAARLVPALRAGGRIAVIDYTPKTMEERPWGPPPEQQISRAELDAAMAEAGLRPSQAHEFLTEQYFVEYRPV